MTRSSITVAFALAVIATGCSSSTSTPVAATDAGAHATDAATTATADSGATGADAGEEAAARAMPATPSLVSIEPLAGGLHVTWKLNDTGLTGVEVWRKKDTGTYAKAFTLPGTATSQHDEGATAPGKYCYQVMTVRGADMSDMSPEKCGTP